MGGLARRLMKIGTFLKENNLSRQGQNSGAVDCRFLRLGGRILSFDDEAM